MKYDAPATAASVARGITRSDVRKILTGLPRENILLRESKRCERVEFIVRILLRIGEDPVCMCFLGVGTVRKKYFALIQELRRYRAPR